MLCSSFKKPVKINALKLTFKIQKTVYIKTCIRQKFQTCVTRFVKKELKTCLRVRSIISL